HYLYRAIDADGPFKEGFYILITSD
ncbi:hypothetical protein SIQ_02543, partial [Enterococcus faecium EnGen0155]